MTQLGCKICLILFIFSSFVERKNSDLSQEGRHQSILTNTVIKYIEAINKRDAQLLSETIDCNLYSRNIFQVKLADSIIFKCSDFIRIQNMFWKIGQEIYESKKKRRGEISHDENERLIIYSDKTYLINQSEDRAAVLLDSTKVLNLYQNDSIWFIYDAYDYDGNNFFVDNHNN